MRSRRRRGDERLPAAFHVLDGTMRACAAVVVFLWSAAPLLLLEASTCQMARHHGQAGGDCPVRMTSAVDNDVWGYYTVTLRVWMTADDLCNFPNIEILGKKTLKPTLKKSNCVRKVDKRRHFDTRRVRCHGTTRNNPAGLWELTDEVHRVGAGRTLSVTYSVNSTSCTVSHTVPDPVPDFEVSVNRLSKKINVTVESEREVYVNWCFSNQMFCMSTSPPVVLPLGSQSVPLSVPSLLPCVCVQAYYTFVDARRREKCPFKDNTVDVGDLWQALNVILYRKRLELSAPCPASILNVSASLCWLQHQHCTPLSNSTLEKSRGPPLEFNTGSVDRHPQICVQFSLQESHIINCPFESATTTWEVTIGPGRRSFLVYLSSREPATFSAQLCVLSETGCVPAGSAQSVTMGNTTEEINVPFHTLTEQLCVQVWQSDPALQGSRILCLDYTHNRRGIYAAVALVFMVGVMIPGIFIRSVVKSGAAGWLQFQKPLLLVCSSEQSAHVSAVCALASILQEELGATVHTSLWAQSSQTHAATSVADLGPLPWLYGQWEAVSKAQGKVLVIWSPEAKKTFEKWRVETESVARDEKKVENQRKAGERLEKAAVVERGDWKSNRKVLGKFKREKTADDFNDRWQPKEPSAVIQPVFIASLACLDGALQKCKGQRTAIVYFQGLGHSRDIPKVFREVPRYCLPQDFRGLLQELGGLKTQTEPSEVRWRCWPRLLSKVLSIYQARQLARRLQAVLPWTGAPSVSSTVKKTSDQTAGRLRLLLAARPQTVPEQEPLHGSLQEL